MAEKTRKAIGGLIGVVLFSAVISVPIIGKPQPPSNWTDFGDAWASFVYNYQTLISGLAAVGAAYITVDQMRRSDREQERRHRRQLYIDNIRELTAARRFLDRITPELQKLVEAAVKLEPKLSGDAFQGINDGVHAKYGWSQGDKIQYFMSLRAVTDLIGVLGRSTEIELELLSHDLQERLNQFRVTLERVGKIANQGKSFWEVMYTTDRAPKLYDGHVADDLLVTVQQARILENELKAWFAELDAQIGENNH